MSKKKDRKKRKRKEKRRQDRGEEKFYKAPKRVFINSGEDEVDFDYEGEEE